MHKGFMKLIVGGTLAVVVGLIVASTASARILIPSSQESSSTSSSTSSLLGYPRGVVGAPGLSTADSTPLTSLLGYPRGVVGAPGLETAPATPVTHQAQKQTFVSSYGDFPEVVRTMSLGNAAHTTSSSGGFDWNDTGIGVGVAIGVASIIGLLAFGIRRSKATPATA
jgi:hypothetical protein